MTEVWAPAPGFPSYEVSSTGNVRRIGVTRGKIGKQLTLIRNGEGRASVKLRRDDRTFTRVVAPLVCEAFHGPGNGRLCDHENLDPSDDREANLRWLTKAQNGGNTKKRGAFKGVSRREASWIAYGRKGGRTLYLGIFDTPEQAAVAYDNHARSAYGVAARLNFPREGEAGA